MQGFAHRADQKTEPADVQEMRPRNFAALGLIGGDEGEEPEPDKEIENVAKFSGQERNRFKEDRHSRNKHDCWRRQEQILPEKNERLEWRFTSDQKHGHGGEHEPAEKGDEKGQVPQEFRAEIF